MRQAPLLPRRPPGEDGPFARFWAAYPRRTPNPKPPALEVFRKLLRGGADPDELVRAAERFRAEAERLGTPPTYIPHARTWLAQRRFEDYLDAQGEPGPGDAAAEPEHPLARALPELSVVELRAWLDPVRIDHRGSAAIIWCPSAAHAELLRGRYGHLLPRALKVRVVRYEVSRDEAAP